MTAFPLLATLMRKAIITWHWLYAQIAQPDIIREKLSRTYVCYIRWAERLSCASITKELTVKIILCRLADADQSRYVVLKNTRLQNAEADWSLAIENQAP